LATRFATIDESEQDGFAGIGAAADEDLDVEDLVPEGARISIAVVTVLAAAARR
jgi:hypothetical protein